MYLEDLPYVAFCVLFKHLDLHSYVSLQLTCVRLCNMCGGAYASPRAKLELKPCVTIRPSVFNILLDLQTRHRIASPFSFDNMFEDSSNYATILKSKTRCPVYLLTYKEAWSLVYQEIIHVLPNTTTFHYDVDALSIKLRKHMKIAARNDSCSVTCKIDYLVTVLCGLTKKYVIKTGYEDEIADRIVDVTFDAGYKLAKVQGILSELGMNEEERDVYILTLDYA